MTEAAWTRHDEVAARLAAQRNEQPDELEHLRAALRAARLPHLVVEDCWYSCPKSGQNCDDRADPDECRCGADEHNARIDAALGCDR